MQCQVHWHHGHRTPFVIVLQSLAGRSAVTKMTERFGLTQDAAKAAGHVFTSQSSTSSTFTGLSWVFLILGGIAAAAVLQELYERAFDAEGRGITDKPRQSEHSDPLTTWRCWC